MTFRGHIENGLVVLDSPCALPEDTAVTVMTDSVSSPHEVASPKTHLELALEILSSVPEDDWDSLPRDGARNVDHYLYGAPRKAE